MATTTTSTPCNMSRTADVLSLRRRSSPLHHTSLRLNNTPRSRRISSPRYQTSDDNYDDNHDHEISMRRNRSSIRKRRFSTLSSTTESRAVRLFTITVSLACTIFLLSEVDINFIWEASQQYLLWWKPRPERLFPRIAFVEPQLLPPSSLLRYHVIRLQHNRTARPLLHTQQYQHHYHHSDHHSHRIIKYPMATEEFFDHLTNSRDFRSRADPMKSRYCEPRYAWQTTSRPVCNKLHELDLASTQIYSSENMDSTAAATIRTSKSRFHLIANGFWADIWVYANYHDASAPITVIKTLRYVHPINTRNIDRNRRDSMAMERLTSAKYVVNTYGYCGISGIVEYSDGGDLGTAIWPRGGSGKQPLTPVQKLRLGTYSCPANGAVSLRPCQNFC